MTWIQGNQTHPSWPAPFYYHPLSLFNLFSVSLSFFYLHLVTQTWNVALTPLWFENNDRLLIHSTHVNVLWVLPEIPEGRMCKINWRVISCRNGIPQWRSWRVRHWGFCSPRSMWRKNTYSCLTRNWIGFKRNLVGSWWKGKPG